MKITTTDVAAVARLARLEFDSGELETLRDQLERILDHVEQLNALDTGVVEPMAHALQMENAFRPDAVTPSLSLEQALANAPQALEGCFGVPKVIE
ncbi:Asp-tRNA(Asn)/Glu-tRNA(Gln) amidotransferase subunit GatC [Desulfuromonas thiophila]|jgi:aspartyl-tRNA(Asn)/glutamyl-tRNA(Gln) amidotransferase subunit C|uniref:Aspartyl/glutamyl-tRNA(Asn/Gln) amidotransferase subunit C n=1 Tax=Desulfuromonas thiophila TaxID=57664 RepID=A0A1G6XNH3_9BACT|nr:Asp-tRNA(Asn)/Glu-tRNA(Gln) amidotransferase subunit GatC [Desulfuromonas thiophila]MDD3801125.1 Asp-tRNA(Asn)/Glu-tRNA(Gln) amidotransferase subunit GatC [Desulfuromonas thiophila]MDY0398671.1 Asp-tRNA(Asn)/Glu-tRNA(Gln) amidotransferase subunit GatC [Desulfuromonas thiophila]SDD79720.1 aspartyl/glutamyl-tRNA(Asn/Gln) amidotransferase subunit C [Desulfuromonas thiophila]